MDLGLQEPKDASMQPSKVEGAFGFSVFQFSHLKKMHFLVLVSYAVCGFSSNLVFGFRFLSTMMAVFRIFLSNAFYGFSGFGKEIATCSRAKTVIPMASYIALYPFFQRNG